MHGDPEDRVWMWDPVKQQKSYGNRAPMRKSLADFVKVCMDVYGCTYREKGCLLSG